MTMQDTITLSKLSDTGQTVSTATDDIRGRKMKDRDGNDLGRIDDARIRLVRVGTR